jgi:hypothetical protein
MTTESGRRKPIPVRIAASAVRDEAPGAVVSVKII